MLRISLLLLAFVFGACAQGGGEPIDAGQHDASTPDANSVDAAVDGGVFDADVLDVGTGDAGAPDLGAIDAGTDAGAIDLGSDAGPPTLLGMAWNPPDTGGGILGIITNVAFVLEFEDAPCIAGPLGNDVAWSSPGMYDFNESNEADFTAVAACLSDSINQEFHTSTRAGGGGGGNSTDEETGFGDIAGHSIAFVRLIVSSFSISNDGSFTEYSYVTRWEIWGH